MELKACSHTHYILAIKGALVEKILCVDSQGRPGFRFKKLKTIYESENARNLSACSTSHQKVERFMDVPNFQGIKIECPILPMSGRRTLKSVSETSALTENGGDDKRNNDWDDLDSVMTLKQLQIRCKAKKRKLSTSDNLTKQNLGTCVNLKQEYTSLQLKEDESDLEETLSSWRSKISKKLKSKKKCTGKQECSSSRSSISVVETEKALSSPLDSLQNMRGLLGPNNVKIEISEPDSLDDQTVVFVTEVSTSDCHVKVDFKELPVEVPERVDGNDLETEGSTSFTKESLNCVINKESSSCIINEISIEHLHHAEPFSLPISVTTRETIEVGFSNITIHDTLPSSVSELKKESKIPNSFLYDNPPEAVSLAKDQGSEMYRKCESYSSLLGELSCQIHNNSMIQMSDMEIDDSLRFTEHNHGGDGCMLDIEGEVLSKEVTLSDLEANALSNSDSHNVLYMNSNPCLNPSYGFNSMDDGSCITGKKFSLPIIEGSPSSCLDEAGDRLVRTHPSDATDGFKATKMLGNHHCLKLERLPKRLFSTRKTISPTSKEKLLQAADATEMHVNKELSYCWEKLRFGKWRKNKDSLVGSGMESAEVPIKSEQIIKKRKSEGGSPQLVRKGILKASHASSAIPHAANECTSIDSRAQKAIAFSQRQMHDTECLAMKLMKELKSMQDIVEETLKYEVYMPTYLKYSADEMRTAIGNAMELEVTTRKWLSMMARDCSRFCKIMRSTKKAATAAASGDDNHKERKKISFADEAGGMLCQVKVFEDCSASLLNCETEKPVARS